jgi:Histone methylation protein DOT1
MTFSTSARAKLDHFGTSIGRTRAEHGTARCLLRAGSEVIGASRRAGGYLLESLADRRYGMDTRGIVKNDDVLRDRVRRGDGKHYQATPVHTFHRIVAAAALDPRRTTFIDLGSGRGRCVLLAARAGFSRAIGVELDPQLTEQAQQNIRRYRADSRSGRPLGEIEARLGDAATVALPPGDLLVFLYNPFGAATLADVLARIAQAHRDSPRRIMLCYSNPVHREVVECSGVFQRTADGRDWIVYACTAATHR